MDLSLFPLPGFTGPIQPDMTETGARLKLPKK